MVDMPGKMNRTFSVNRIPAGRVCTAEKLDFQSQACRRLRYIASDNSRYRLPGGTTGRTSYDGNIFDFSRFYFDIQFR